MLLQSTARARQVTSSLKPSERHPALVWAHKFCAKIAGYYTPLAFSQLTIGAFWISTKRQIRSHKVANPNISAGTSSHLQTASRVSKGSTSDDDMKAWCFATARWKSVTELLLVFKPAEGFKAVHFGDVKKRVMFWHTNDEKRY